MNFVKDRFIPTLIYAREDADFHTRLCVYNYFSEIFPGVKTGAILNVWAFDKNGKIVGQQQEKLGFRGQIQLEMSDVAKSFEGMAGLSMIPETLPEFNHGGVGTGYYSYYYDNDGHADFSHEWSPMKFVPMKSQPWICVVRPLLLPNTQIIGMNSYFGADEKNGQTEWKASLRNEKGTVVASKEMPVIPARGIYRGSLREIFPDVLDLARESKVLSFEALGQNLQGPFTFITSNHGDFNIHHFC